MAGELWLPVSVTQAGVVALCGPVTLRSSHVRDSGSSAGPCTWFPGLHPLDLSLRNCPQAKAKAALSLG